VDLKSVERAIGEIHAVSLVWGPAERGVIRARIRTG
jgi:hypothetical protein